MPLNVTGPPKDVAPTTLSDFPICKSPPIPTPPATTKAPVKVFVESAVLLKEILLVVAEPLFVIDCNVELFQIVTDPPLVLTTVSVPWLIVITPVFSILVYVVAVVSLIPGPASSEA